MRLVAIVLFLAACAPPATYSASPQWRGARFENPEPWPRKKGIAGVLKWRLSPRAPHGRFVPPTVVSDGGLQRANGHRASVTWIGHATALLQAGGRTILTDPVFSEAVGGLFARTAPPGIPLARLPRIDVVVISHNHYDHLDEDSVRALGPEVHYVVPLGLARWFRARGLPRVVELDWWQATEVAGVRVTLVPAQHWSQRTATDQNQSLWGGYVVDAGGTRFYFAGDTGYPAAFAEIGRRFPGIDFALLPIGAYEPRWFMRAQHMSPEDAARAFRELGARTLVPIHWATFKLTDEPMDEPPARLYRAMGVLANRILFLPIGGAYFSPPSPPEADTAVAAGADTGASPSAAR